MEKIKFEIIYWKHYKVLEADFVKTLRYVELDKTNYNTYSAEYSKQIQAICSEIEVLLKLICNYIEQKEISGNIKDYLRIIITQDADILKLCVKCVDNPDINFNPWNSIFLEKKVKAPTWWKEYNSVKHDRMGYNKENILNYKKANLENVINSLAALYILERVMYSKFCTPIEGVPTSPERDLGLFTIKEDGWNNGHRIGDIWIDIKGDC